MSSRRFVFFYLLILALALFLRLFQLGAVPLSDYEATWALQALGLARGERPLLGSQTVYNVSTAWLFFVFGANNFMARFWPALAGTLLLFVPWLWRERLGERVTLILALGLAIDPGLWALSRLAGGPMMAATFLTLTVALWMQRRYALAGVCAGLALLAGPAFWFGLLALTLSGLAYALWFRLASDADGPRRRFAVDRATVRAALPWALGTLLLVGTGFALVPQALGGMAQSLPQFLRGWWTPTGVRAWQVALALPADEALPLLFGLIAAGRGFWEKDRFSVALSLWALIAFLLTMLYPGRQTGDLVWTMVPLWTLAAVGINRCLHWEDVDTRVVLPLASFTLVLLMLAWFMLAHTRFGWVEGDLFQQPVLQMALGVLVFLALSLVMVGLYWDAATALRGGVWGLLAALVINTLGCGTSATGLRSPPAVSLWQPAPTVAQADLLRLTVDQISNWNRGYVAMLPLRLAGVDSPALRWLFRDYEVTVTVAMGAGDEPEVLITPGGALSLQEAGYRGQDFVWRQRPTWDAASVLDWLRWWLFRAMPQESEDLILWVRSDLKFME